MGLYQLPKELSQDIETILQELSEEFEEGFNFQYVLDKTNEYFKERNLEKHVEQIKDLLEEGKIAEQGTHKQLLKLGGLYAESYRRQQLRKELEGM